ncbi:MAG: T9SS type A sorting domain-containing protein [Bacteroidales bacterium]|nr:T9SS type A sorting domain-containing protein [Bacteroidales bacterium]
MKKSNLILYSLLFSICQWSYSQKLISEWAISAGGPDADGCQAITMDSYGNLIVTGYFQSKAKFGSHVLQPFGDTDIFLAKYSNNGKLLWVKNFGSMFTKNITITESGNDVAVDSKDNMYVVGRFAEAASFMDTTIKSAGGYDIFFAKLDKDGNLEWVEGIGNHMYDVSNSIFIDGNDNIYLSGTSQGTLMLGNYLMSTIGTNAFIAKYSSDGNIQWVKHMQMKGNAEISEITGNDKFVYVAGFFEKDLIFEDKRLESSGDRDMFLAKLTSEGSLVWVTHSDECTRAKANTMCLKDNDIYLTGSYNKWLSMGDKKIMSEGKDDVFVVKYSDDGQVAWLKSIGGPGQDIANAISILGSNGCLISGMYSDQLFLGDTTMESNGLEDLFIINIDLSGKTQWAMSFGSTLQDRLMDVIVDKSNDIILTGFMRESMLFDNIILNSNGGSDIFIGKLMNYQNEIQSTDNFLADDEITEFELYPNPCKGNFSIYTNTEFLEEIKYFEIRNALGESVKIIKKSAGNKITVNISNFPNGVYFIEAVTNDDDVYSRKLVKL